MSDQIKGNVINTIILSGELAEIEVRKGNEKKSNAPYVSIKGAIKVGDSKAQMVRFEKYQAAYRVKDGVRRDYPAYDKLLEFAENAVSLASAKEGQEVTKVRITGSYKDAPYVGRDGQLKQATKIEASFFNDFKGNTEAIADVEGYVNSVVRETKAVDGEAEETGRLRVTIITFDFFKNAIPVTFIVETGLAEAFEDNISTGQTITALLEYKLNEKVAPTPVREGGIGVQRASESTTRSYLELVLTGTRGAALDPEDDGALSTEAVKAAMNEREQRLNKLVEEGYKGSASTSTNRSGIGGVQSKPVQQAQQNAFPKDDDDEDVLF